MGPDVLELLAAYALLASFIAALIALRLHQTNARPLLFADREIELQLEGLAEMYA